jgi:hypothetical protein
MKKAAGGAVSKTNSNGLSWHQVTELKMCAADLKSCMEDEKMFYNVCWEITSADSNPDVEGDSNTWIDGLKALRAMALGRPMKEDVKGKKRLLQEATKFDKWIAIAEKHRLLSNKDFSESEELTDRFDPIKEWRILPTKVTRHSGSQGSHSGSGSSSSSGSGVGIGLGRLHMDIKKGVDIFKDYKSGATITPEFSTKEAIQAGSAMPSYTKITSVAIGLLATIALFIGGF